MNNENVWRGKLAFRHNAKIKTDKTSHVAMGQVCARFGRRQIVAQISQQRPVKLHIYYFCRANYFKMRNCILHERSGLWRLRSVLPLSFDTLSMCIKLYVKRWQTFISDTFTWTRTLTLCNRRGGIRVLSFGCLMNFCLCHGMAEANVLSSPNYFLLERKKLYLEA